MTEPQGEHANTGEHPAPPPPGAEISANPQESPPDAPMAAAEDTALSTSIAQPTRSDYMVESGDSTAGGEGAPADMPLSAAPESLGEPPAPTPISIATPVAEQTPAPTTSSDIAAEVARLREENVRLRRELRSTQASATRTRTHTARRISTIILLVLTCFGLLFGSLTLWVNNEFLNTDNWVALVTPLGQDPQVIDAISAYTANEVISVLNVRQRAQEALPPRAEFLAVPLTAVIHDFVQKRVTSLMHTPQFEQLWISANRYAHAQVLAALRGQTKNVIIENGTVTLNLIPIIRQALAALQQSISGLLPGNVRLPDVSQLQVPSQARARLAQALGVQVPSDFGVITLFSSEQLAKAQQLLQVFDLLTILLPIVTLLLLVATIWASPSRRRTLIQLGLGVAIIFLIARILVGYLEGRIVESITNPTGHSIAAVVIPTAAVRLQTLTVLILAIGIVVALIAYLVGKPEWFAAGYAQCKVAYNQVRTEYGHIREALVRRQRPT